MSSDLLKEFGELEENPWSHVPDGHVNLEKSTYEDEFGDFENPEASESITKHQAISEAPLETTLHSHNSKGWASSKRIEAAKQTNDASMQQTGSPSAEDNDWGNFTDGTTVLFDAERTITTEQSQRHSDSHQVETHKSAAEKPMKVSLLPRDSREANTHKSKLRQAHLTEPYDFGQAESWESVDVAQVPLRPGSATTPAVPSLDSNVDGIPCARLPTRDMGPAPSNVPPPSVLLSVTAGLFRSISGDVRNIIIQSGISSSTSGTLNEQQIESLKETLSATRVAARIIAGRKLRWKRDNVLSQSMKIGPAGKSGGMKLAGVDKAESRREDQETAETLNVWRKQVGPLRSSISLVKPHLRGGGLVVPETSESIPIRVIKPSEGAVSAPKCCFLCGIKRDERAAKVDVDVEDSFGEFWTEHWGHVECVAFWEKYKHSLPHR